MGRSRTSWARGQSGNPAGRKPSIPETSPRLNMRTIIRNLVVQYGGDEKMLKCLDTMQQRYIDKPTDGRARIVLQLAELWAQVVDRIDLQQGALAQGVTIIVNGFNPMALRPGGPPMIALPAPGKRNGQPKDAGEG